MENKNITNALKIILCDIFETLQSVGPILSGPGDLSDLKPETVSTISALLTGLQYVLSLFEG